jgi:hypothetical protein
LGGDSFSWDGEHRRCRIEGTEQVYFRNVESKMSDSVRRSQKDLGLELRQRAQLCDHLLDGSS